MFGEGAGDKMMKGRRGFTNLTLSMPIVYYQEEELQVFVSTPKDNFLVFFTGIHVFLVPIYSVLVTNSRSPFEVVMLGMYLCGDQLFCPL